MISGIYKIESKDGKVYIGSSIDIKARKAKHIKQLECNKHINKHMQNVWNKYGSDYFTFSIIETIEDKTKLLYYEQIWLDILFQSLDRDNIYNAHYKANSPLGCKRSDQTKYKMSLAQKGNKYGIGNKSNTGRKLSNEHKIKVGLSSLGRNAKTYPAVLSPNGEVTVITNMNRFCIDNNLNNVHLAEVSKGKRKSHKGWTLALQ